MRSLSVQFHPLFDHPLAMPDREIDLIVPAELAGERFDRAAAVLIEDASRSEIGRWIKAGWLRLNGAVARPRQVVAADDRLAGRFAVEPKLDWQQAEAIDLPIVFEDDDLLVIDKPVGLVVHPGAGHATGTMVNALLGHRGDLAALPRAGIVHRLDKDTSGLLVVAANAGTYQALVEALRERKIDRQYLAVVEGVNVRAQTIDAPIGRDPLMRTRQKIRSDGRPARTHIEVEAQYSSHTLIRAKLDTGRTHQVRVHMASIGHPLVGDRRYRARGVLPAGATEAARAVVRAFDRQALHAHTLRLTHPGTGRRMKFVSPLPTDMETLIDAVDV